VDDGRIISGVRVFGTFQLDLEHRELRQAGRRIRLTAKPFDCLAFFVENRGEVITRDHLRATVWAGTSVTDPAIEHAVNKVRRAIEDDPTDPKFIKTLWGKGYIFVADVELQGRPGSSRAQEAESSAEGGVDRQDVFGEDGTPLHVVSVEDVATEQPTSANLAPLPHKVHAVFVCLLYGVLYSGAIIAETSYGFDSYGRTALLLGLPVFVWMAGTMWGGLWADSQMVVHGRRGAAAVSISVLAFAAVSLLVTLQWFLPSSSITSLSFQGLTAYSAYLKDTTYVYTLGIVFVLLPFHYVVSLEREIRAGRLEITTARLAHKTRAVFIRPGLLLAILVGVGAWSQVSIAHIFENLRPGPYLGLYMNLVQIERFLGLALALECLAWYHLNLTGLDRGSK